MELINCLILPAKFYLSFNSINTWSCLTDYCKCTAQTFVTVSLKMLVHQTPFYLITCYQLHLQVSSFSALNFGVISACIDENRQNKNCFILNIRNFNILKHLTILIMKSSLPVWSNFCLS